MKKLKLNKKTISVLDKNEMGSVKGGTDEIEFLSISSCRRSRRGPDAKCCRNTGGCF